MNNKSFFKHIKSKQPGRHFVSPADDQDIREYKRKDTAEKLNEFFASVLSGEETGVLSLLYLFFLRDFVQTALFEVEVSIKQVMEQIGKMKSNKSPKPCSTHP